MKRYSFVVSLGLFLSFLFSACNPTSSDKKNIAVTIEPQRYFAEKIAGDKFEIYTVVPAGQSPETYDPAPKQMVQIGKSIAYLQIGHIGFEQVWMESIRANNPNMQIFDLSEGLELIEEMHVHGDDCEHDHEAEMHHHHHHHHSGIDPHIWNCIAGARMIAWNTLQALIKLDESNSQYYWNNYNELVKEIDATADVVTELLEPLENRVFIIYHPALTYFANEFDLVQLSIEMDGKEPSPSQMKRLIDTAREHNAKIVFIQQEFDQKNAELVAKETSCKLVTINPLDYDWSKEMIHLAKSLANE